MARIDLRGTTYLSAFVMQAIVCTITSIVAILAHGGLTHLPVQWSVVMNVGITFLSTLVVLVVMHLLFGYGGGLIDTTTSHQRRHLLHSWWD